MFSKIQKRLVNRTPLSQWLPYWSSSFHEARKTNEEGSLRVGHSAIMRQKDHFQRFSAHQNLYPFFWQGVLLPYRLNFRSNPGCYTDRLPRNWREIQSAYWRIGILAWHDHASLMECETSTFLNQTEMSLQQETAPVMIALDWNSPSFCAIFCYRCAI